MINKELERLKKLYCELGDIVAKYHIHGISPLVVHWGHYYPMQPNAGILFVGRAINGSNQRGKYLDQLEVAIQPQNCNNLKWVEEDMQKKGSNCRRSAFWRVIRGVAKEIYGDSWFEHVAWSDLYKVAPSKGGNPNKRLKGLQKGKCQEILAQEIMMLSPRIVILFVGNWIDNFLFLLNSHQPTKSIANTVVWGHGRKSTREYKVKVYYIDRCVFILTEHPQGKNEANHITALVKSINTYMNRKDL